MYPWRMRILTCLALVCLVAVEQEWRQSFPVDVKTLATQGENAYFILKPGYQSTFESTTGRLIITVLDQTVKVGGVDTRVVEEREFSGNDLVEVSRNFFAIDPKTGDVYYFGEEVDIYKAGKPPSHEGSWQHGTKGATFGLMMPGKPAVGMRFYQEQAKGVAMDRAEILSVTDHMTTRAGSFAGCVKTLETSPLEPKTYEYKEYAPGVGLVKDGNMRLVSHQYVR
jgi:hypothetical protein